MVSWWQRLRENKKREIRTEMVWMLCVSREENWELLIKVVIEEVVKADRVALLNFSLFLMGL
jgi:hypothetical protein